MRFYIIKSHLKNKKYDGIFEDGIHRYIIPFGASGYDDYTITNNDKQKELYLKRHRKRENWNDPYTSGSLSRWILWNKKTLNQSIKDFKNKFNFN
jgi:hypothetical protein